MSVIIENLTKRYGMQNAIDSISFTLKRGEVVGFIGPNGSGKSTTMKSICGILKPDSGKVLIDGHNVAESGINIKKKIGYLPENNPLYQDQYVREYLYHVGKIYKIKKLKDRIDGIVKLTGLEQEQHKKIGELSKGYKQRVGLAQALIHDPEILILDEPTTGLDPNQLAEIRDLIIKISKEKAVLLSTHILQEVEAICQRVIMINKGRIVTDDTAESIKNNTQDKHTVIVEFKQKVKIDKIKTIPGVSNCKMVGNNKWVLEAGEGNDIREKIFEFAKANDVSILELQMKKNSLEDTFRILSSKNQDKRS